jgi:ParB-like chromosome segregation protein Spo0J
MQRKEVEVSKIKPYERNNKKHSQAQIDLLAKQIQEHKYDQPIVVDKDLVIIKGHARHLALQQLGYKSIEVVVRDDLTPEQCAAARLADNRISALGEDDMEMIKLELSELKLEGFDLELTGFDAEFLEKLSPEFEPDLPDDEDKEKEHGKLVLRVEFENEEEMQQLFFELRDRGLAVKI